MLSNPPPGLLDQPRLVACRGRRLSRGARASPAAEYGISLTLVLKTVVPGRPGPRVNLSRPVLPAVLFHGTGLRHLDAIMRAGLRRAGRHHVHLFTDAATATRVGARHGRPVVLEVAATRMREDGFTFYVTANGVWPTLAIPPRTSAFARRPRRVHHRLRKPRGSYGARAGGGQARDGRAPALPRDRGRGNGREPACGARAEA